MTIHKTLYAFFLVFGFLFTVSYAQATVGGPTYIDRVAYKAADNTIYYLSRDQGGRGCPTIVKKINLTTGAQTEAMTCTQFEERNYTYNQAGGTYPEYIAFIEQQFEGAYHMHPIHLEKNGFAAELEFISDHFSPDFPEEMQWSDFKLSISQDGQVKTNLDIMGCGEDQPFLLEGYWVPETKHMMMLVSGKGDCYEGGYTVERLYHVPGVTYRDTNPINPQNVTEGIELKAGNLVVYAQGERVAPTAPAKRDSNTICILGALLVFAVGCGIGYLMKKRA